MRAEAWHLPSGTLSLGRVEDGRAAVRPVNAALVLDRAGWHRSQGLIARNLSVK
jgi:hypothetical protein